MSDDGEREAVEPTRDEVNRMEGPVVLEFGTGWCGFCRAAAPAIRAQTQRFPEIRHLTIEDGPGRPLGRSFRVTLWPTLVFLRDGTVVARLVRPEPAELRTAFERLADGG